MSAGELPSRRPIQSTRRQRVGLTTLFGVIGTFVVVGAAFLIAPRLACGCTPVAQTPDVVSPVEGVVIAVDASGLNDVRGFTLRTNGGFAFTFVLGILENATDFPPGHIAEHQATSSPVRVWFHPEGGQHVVYRMEDAGTPSAT